MYRLHGAIHAYGGTTVSARDTADSVITALTPAAWYRNATDVVSSGGFASIWADYASSDKGLVLPGVDGNYASTPDSVPVSITGDIDIRVRIALADWTPAAALTSLVAKDDNISPRSYTFFVSQTTGKLSFFFDNGGGATATSSSSAATGFTDGSAHWVRVTRASSTGFCNFYTANDSSTEPSSWTLLGTGDIVGAAGNLADTTEVLGIGASSGGTWPSTGILYRAIVKDGIDGTTVFDADFSAQAIGTASFTESSSNAATVTINTSGASPAHIGKARDLLQGTGTNQPAYAAGVLTFDGADNYLKATAFTLTQPETIIIVGKQITWSSADGWADGNTVNSGAVYQGGAGQLTPKIGIYAGGADVTAHNANLAVNTRGILCCVLNGASSTTRVNNTATVTAGASIGAANMGGFILGALGTPQNYSNIAVEEVVLFASALSDANQDAVITALNNALTVF